MKKLTEKQKELDVDNDGVLEASDFAALRGGSRVMALTLYPLRVKEQLKANLKYGQVHTLLDGECNAQRQVAQVSLVVLKRKSKQVCKQCN